LSWYAGGRYPGGFESGRDGADYAGIASHIIQDGCFCSDVIYPLYLFFDFIDSEEIAAGNPVPQLNRQPVFPIYLAGAFYMFGISEQIAEIAAFLPIIAVAVLLLLGGWKIFNYETGLSAALLYLSHPNIVRNSVKTLSEPLATLFLLSIILFLPGIYRSKNRNMLAILLLGVLSGLLALTKLPMILVLPLIVSIAFFSETRKLKALAVWACVFGLLLLPWFMRNVSITGNPLFSIQSYCEVTKFLPGTAPYEAHRSLEPVTYLQAAASNPVLLGQTFLRGVAVTFLGTLRLVFWLLPFFLIHSILRLVFSHKTESEEDESRKKPPPKSIEPTGTLVSETPTPGNFDTRAPAGLFINKAQYRFTKISILTYAASGILYAILSPDLRHLLPILPLIVLSAAGLFEQRFPLKPKFCILASIAAALLNLTILSMGNVPYDTGSSKTRSSAEEIERLVQTRGPIISDQTTSLAWFLDRSVIWLPVDQPTLEAICSRTKPGAIFLSDILGSNYLVPYGGRNELESQISNLGFEPVPLSTQGTLFIKPVENRKDVSEN